MWIMVDSNLEVESKPLTLCWVLWLVPQQFCSKVCVWYSVYSTLPAWWNNLSTGNLTGFQVSHQMIARVLSLSVEIMLWLIGACYIDFFLLFTLPSGDIYAKPWFWLHCISAHFSGNYIITIAYSTFKPTTATLCRLTARHSSPTSTDYY